MFNKIISFYRKTVDYFQYLRDCNYRNYACSIKAYRKGLDGIEVKLRYYGRGNYLYRPLPDVITDIELLDLLSPIDVMNLATIHLKYELINTDEEKIKTKLESLLTSMEEK